MGKPRRRAAIAALERRQGGRARGYREPREAALARGPSLDYEAPPGAARWVIGPFEAGLRFPSVTFNYGVQVALAQGAAVATVLTFTVPAQMNGVLRGLVIYSTLPAGIADLTALELLIDQVPQRGLLVVGAAPATAILPDASFEEPALTFNIHLKHLNVVALRLGRVGAIDPVIYTYRARITGWYWPKYRRRGW